MYAFNAVQLVFLFSCLPFIIGWLHKGPFVYSTGIMWLTIAFYVSEFVWLCVAATQNLYEMDGKK